MSNKKSKPEKVANPALALAMLGKRSSGAAGPHADRRTRRVRTRGASKARAIREGY